MCSLYLSLYLFGLCVLLTTSETQIESWNILVKAVVLRINLNIDGAPTGSRSNTQKNQLGKKKDISSVSSGVPVPPPGVPTVYVSRVDLQALVFSLSSHRHSYKYLLVYQNCLQIWSVYFLSLRKYPETIKLI
jgi:hypothetical protein